MEVIRKAPVSLKSATCDDDAEAAKDSTLRHSDVL
jgi:hypothetical protein